jgi:hypothetical protein
MGKGALTIPKSHTATALTLPDGLTFSAWQAIGERLRQVRAGSMFWTGDWLNYGERRYGEMYAQALEATDWDYETLRAAKWVAEKVESVRRRTDLSWSHHREVASLTPAKQDKFLDEAVTKNWSRAELRAAVRDIKSAKSVQVLFAEWAEHVKARFEHAKADLDLLHRIEGKKVELTGFENGKPVVVDRKAEARARIDAALSANPKDGKTLHVWYYRRLDRHGVGEVSEKKTMKTQERGLWVGS